MKRFRFFLTLLLSVSICGGLTAAQSDEATNGAIEYWVLARDDTGKALMRFELAAEPRDNAGGYLQVLDPGLLGKIKTEQRAQASRGTDTITLAFESDRDTFSVTLTPSEEMEDEYRGELMVSDGAVHYTVIAFVEKGAMGLDPAPEFWSHTTGVTLAQPD